MLGGARQRAKMCSKSRNTMLTRARARQNSRKRHPSSHSKNLPNTMFSWPRARQNSTDAPCRKSRNTIGTGLRGVHWTLSEPPLGALPRMLSAVSGCPLDALGASFGSASPHVQRRFGVSTGRSGGLLLERFPACSATFRGCPLDSPGASF